MTPAVRTPCLDIVLRCTITPDETLRGKAIRLVANKLFPMPIIAQQIGEFARARLQNAAPLAPRAHPKP